LLSTDVRARSVSAMPEACLSIVSISKEYWPLGAGFLILAGLARLVWAKLFQPLFVLQPKTSFGLRERLLPIMQRSSGSLTTLSSGALVLTFTIVQAFGKERITHKGWLVASWTGFTLTVTCGIIATILVYVLRAHHHVFVQTALTYYNAPAEDRVSAEHPGPLRDQAGMLLRMLMMSLYWQAVFFLMGIALLWFVAVVNLLGSG
jgi:hypothetical protein